MQGKNWSNRVSIKLKLTKGNSYKIISIWLFQYWRTEKLIYIPIWLYSNDVGNIITNGGSGFTFQYGYIQMLMNRQMQMQQMSLHSNMVIFKWTDSRQRRRMREVYIPIWLYSNPDSIDISDCPEVRLHSNMVIFKFCFKKSSLLPFAVYIPIWLYSNSDESIESHKWRSFTFQYGYIQIIFCYFSIISIQ